MDRLKKKNIFNAILISNTDTFINKSVTNSNTWFIKTNFKLNNTQVEKISFNLNDFKFNNVMVSYDNNLNTFLSKNFFGINNYFIEVISKRVEFNYTNNFNFYKFDRWYVFKTLLSDLIPINKSIIDKTLINLNFLFLIKSYRGWRHSFNLPSRGQRTWSNAWSVFKSKNIFRSYKYSCFCSDITNAHPDELKSAFFLEQLNLLWKSQWEKEWLIAVKRRTAQLKKNAGIKKLELNLMAKTNPNFIKNKKNNLIPIGFESGFTKSYLKDIKQLLIKKPKV